MKVEQGQWECVPVLSGGFPNKRQLRHQQAPHDLAFSSPTTRQTSSSKGQDCIAQQLCGRGQALTLSASVSSSIKWAKQSRCDGLLALTRL